MSVEHRDSLGNIYPHTEPDCPICLEEYKTIKERDPLGWFLIRTANFTGCLVWMIPTIILYIVMMIIWLIGGQPS